MVGRVVGLASSGEAVTGGPFCPLAGWMVGMPSISVHMNGCMYS